MRAVDLDAQTADFECVWPPADANGFSMKWSEKGAGVLGTEPLQQLQLSGIHANGGAEGAGEGRQYICEVVDNHSGEVLGSTEISSVAAAKLAKADPSKSRLSYCSIRVQEIGNRGHRFDTRRQSSSHQDRYKNRYESSTSTTGKFSEHRSFYSY